MTWAPLSPWFSLFELHRSIHRQLRVTPQFTDFEIKSQPLDFTNAIDIYDLSRVIDRDLVDQNPPDQRAFIHML